MRHWPKRTAGALLCLLLIGGLVPRVDAQLDAKRAEATRIREAIDRGGERLSLATEAYNQARVERERLEAEVERVEADALAAQARLDAAAADLGRRARTMYKHRTSLLTAFLSLRSLADMGRSGALTGSVLVADTELLDAVDAARVQAEAKAAELSSLRRKASDKEIELRHRADTAQDALAHQRGMLAGVESEIAREIEAQRRAELEAARRAAEEAAAAATPTPAPAGEIVPSPTEPPQEPSAPTGAEPAVHGRAATAVETAVAQLGKPYRWGAAGPDDFDCSGLTMYAWEKAGVELPHSSRSQFAAVKKVSRDQIKPGDLLFYGSPIHHVGIYEGNGIMINAPQTGDAVKRSSIDRADFAGAGRPG